MKDFYTIIFFIYCRSPAYIFLMEKVIYTSFDCLVKCGKHEETLSVNEKIIIDSDQPIFIYPTGKDRISFEVNPAVSSPFYRVKTYNGQTHIFLIGGLYAENVVCKSFNWGGNKCNIEVGTKTITFEGNSDKKIIHLLNSPKNLQFGNFLHINYLLFDDDKHKTLIAYNPKKNTARIFSGDKIEIEKDGFSVYKSPDFYNNIVERYYVDKSGLKVLDKNFSLAENLAFPSENLCYKFMSTIKCGDYKNALSLLSPSLAQNLNEKKLKSYFGQISYFYMLDPSTCFALSDNKNVIYQFFVDAGKIIEINDN